MARTRAMTAARRRAAARQRCPSSPVAPASSPMLQQIRLPCPAVAVRFSIQQPVSSDPSSFARPVGDAPSQQSAIPPHTHSELIISNMAHRGSCSPHHHQPHLKIKIQPAPRSITHAGELPPSSEILSMADNCKW
ncbi:hypothetical protein ACLOJK_019435 [Asimina triloba]